MSGIPSASCGSARAHLLPNSHEKEEFPPVSPAGGHKPDPEVAFPSFSQPALQPRPKHRELPSPRLDPKR